MMQPFPPNQIPAPEQMIEKLNSIDLAIFDLKQREEKLKGKLAWISALTIPISAILITATVLLTIFFSHSLTAAFIAFIIVGMLLMIIAKALESSERQAKYMAYQQTIEAIKQIEEPYGLVYHFRHFLPERYRHLWQSVRKGDYQHIKQYAQAIAMLQDKLEPAKFQHIWYLEFPEIAPPEYEE